jgi:hypothetical protein
MVVRITRGHGTEAPSKSLVPQIAAEVLALPRSSP